MSKDLKAIVKKKYTEIANQPKEQNETSCCGSTGCCDTVDYTIFSDDYSNLQGYHKDADLGLGCGIPTEFAHIKKGHSVLDLGSGAGNDCFVARSIVGESGKVIGIDFTDAMIEKANKNNQKLGFLNVDFIQGDIEEMPLADNSFDIVISNCVLNLVPDKQKAFSEIYRVLKPDGRFCVSDIVISGNLPDKIKEDAEMYAGCVSGAIQKNDYLQIIKENKFKEIDVKKEKEVEIPNTVMLNYISMDDLRIFKKNKTGIFSITVTGIKQ
ncbi:MAG: arsenite methyltransferase [Bacteroidales bacterium]|nr:arsenite methyltransferase [Bacteroidales bacterium]